MKQLAVILFTLTLALGAALAGLWTGDRSFPTETISVRMVPDQIAPGEMGEVQYVYRRFRSCDRRIFPSITDSSGRRFEFMAQASPPAVDRVPGEVDSYVRPVRVSSLAKPGPALYSVRIEDSCNPLQRVWPIARAVNVPFRIRA
jgi:hypothetical protein